MLLHIRLVFFSMSRDTRLKFLPHFLIAKRHFCPLSLLLKRAIKQIALLLQFGIVRNFHLLHLLPASRSQMAVYGVYIINKAGGLIYQYDHNPPKVEVEKTFSYPLDLVLKPYDDRIVVAFGQRDGIKVGHSILSINGVTSRGKVLEDNRNVMEVLQNSDNYPLSIKFGRPKLSTNEKIMLASMFHSLYAIASNLSPLPESSGIQQIETDTFKLHCSQTLTGIKFLVITDPRQGSQDTLLKKIYEIYSDYALKNPFYSIEMPIRCELFDVHLQGAIEQAERTGLSNA